jgi:serine/threonine protein kinase
MNEIFTRTDDTASQVDLVWQRRLDALVCGECTVDDFIDKFLSFSEADADSAWNVVALLDQRFRRGQVPADIYRSVESKIVRRELGAHSAGTTIEFDSSGAAFKVTTERYSVQTSGIRAVTGAANQMDAAAPKFRPAPLKSPPVWTHDRWESPAAEIGRVLHNRYVLEARLGRGGMGTVFKALDRYRCDLPEGNRHVAIKFLHERVAGRPEVLSNLRSEFHCAQALSHPNIVKVYELDQDEDVAFFTMEFLEGELLSEVIERNPQPTPRSYAWTIIRDVGAGLAHAHARNVAHGDLKPQNIMITSSSEVRILDFGASSALSRLRSSAEDVQKSNSTALTPAYASCELLAGAAADPRDDLYALACVSYELLAGQHPFQRRRSTEARDLGMVAERPRGLTRRQWETLAMGLSWDRQNRSISVGDWIARLNPPLVATRRWVRSLKLKTERSAQWTPSLSGAVALLAILLVSGILWGSFNRPWFDRKIGADVAVAQAVPQPAANTPFLADSTAPQQSLASAATSVPMQAIAQTPPLPRRVRTDAAHSALHQANNNVSISAGYYKFGSRQNFAEIHVRRSSGSDGDTSFIWWTEPSSALPGVDYVSQPRMAQFLPNGTHMASLFVRLIPHARQHSAAFYVAIGEPSKGTSLGRVARTMILLIPSR